MAERTESKAQYIRKTRENLGLGRTEFANLLGLGPSGERTVRGWEESEHTPTARKWKDIRELKQKLNEKLANAPFRRDEKSDSSFTFIDLFAGIGGIRLPFQRLNGKCVFTSEWDKFAQKTYLANYGEMPNGDITKISAKDIPDHDILLGGFPCQAFSQAGQKQGFSDTRGTMFFEIQRILAEKRPKAFLLENVKQLQGHDKGRTLKTIIDILEGKHDQAIPDDVPMSEEARHALSDKLNYWVGYKVLRATDFNAPQNRQRIFIVGFNRDEYPDVDFDKLFKWPKPQSTKTRLGDILDDLTLSPPALKKHTLSDKMWIGLNRRRNSHIDRGNGFGYSVFNSESEYANTISARYYKDGAEILIDQKHLGLNPRMLTSRECARLQGFPETFIVDAVSQGQIYKQFGNSVCMKVIEAVSHQIIEALKEAKDQSVNSKAA